MNVIDIKLEQISHCYGVTKVLNNIQLDVKSGDMVALLGPSGCGKTTLLRLVAGLIPLGEGRITFGSEDVSHMATQKRNAAMVFQNYALFPHLTVYENIEYGLIMHKIDPLKRRERTNEIIEKVQLSTFSKRKIHELSGGQQQRVALARSLVIKPNVLLFDEPLSNLDEKLRVTMRQEIKQIQRESGITSLYVTHDQEEAMAIADAIAIMHEGKILQVGTPREVYEKPINAFVASFMGDCNFFESEGVTTLFRPDAIKITPQGMHEAIVTWIEYLGSIQKTKLLWNNRLIIAETMSKDIKKYPFSIGDVVRFDFCVDEEVRF